MTNSTITKINALIACPGIEQCQKDLCVCYYHEDDAEYCAARDILNMVATIVLSKTTPAVSDACPAQIETKEKESVSEETVHDPT